MDYIMIVGVVIVSTVAVAILLVVVYWYLKVIKFLYDTVKQINKATK